MPFIAISLPLPSLYPKLFSTAPMPPPLLTEVAELVIDLVACDTTLERIPTLLSLSTCSKALVPRSQKHIFREVVLFPQPQPSKWTPPAMFAELHRRGALFVTTVLRNPRLGMLVGRLSFRFTGIPMEGEELSFDIARFVDHLVNVRELGIHLGDLPQAHRCDLDFAALTPSSSWKVAMSSLLRNCELRSLTVKHIRRFPAEMLLGKRSVELYDTTLISPEGL